MANTGFTSSLQQLIGDAAYSVNTVTVGPQPLAWLSELSEIYPISHIEHIEDVIETINTSSVDVVIVDDASFDRDDLIDFVSEMKRRLPLVPLAVYSDVETTDYRIALVDAGMDDHLLKSASIETLVWRYQMLIRQRLQNLTLTRHNRALHSVTIISRRMHSAESPAALISEAIELICDVFAVQSVVFAIRENNMLHLYAGAHVESELRLQESIIPPQPYDPFVRAMESSMAMVYQDMSSYQYFTPLPNIPGTGAALFIPIEYAGERIGAMAIFTPPGEPAMHASDTAIFELLTTHFASAYNNLRHYLTQDVAVQSTRQLLRAWQRLTGLYQVDDIISALADLALETRAVRHVLVWLFDTEGNLANYRTSASSDVITTVFHELYQSGTVHRLIDRFDEQMRPLTLRPARMNDPMRPLYRAMETEQVLLLPITDSARLLGGLMISPRAAQGFDAEVLNQMESIVLAVGQTLERNQLLGAMYEQAERLEAIVQTINDGIFFVNADNRVAFCNPQFTELTDIPNSDVIGRSYEHLFERITTDAAEPDTARQALIDAYKEVMDAGTELAEYPTVRIECNNPESNILVELMAIEQTEHGEYGILGLIQQRDPQAGYLPVEPLAINPMMQMIDTISIPLSSLYGSIVTLMEQHNLFTPRKRSQYLQQIEQQARRITSLWRSITEIMHLQRKDVELEYEPVDLIQLLNSLLDGRSMTRQRQRIQTEWIARHVRVYGDELQLERAFIAVIENALINSHAQTPVLVQVRLNGSYAQINVQDRGVGMTSAQIDTLFDPFNGDDDELDETGAGITYYLARTIVQMHNGELKIESRPGWGTIVTMLLPLTEEGINTSETAQVIPFMRNDGLNILVLESQSSFIEPLYQDLESEGHQLLISQSLREAQADASMQRFDLILMEVEAGNTDLINGVGKLSDTTQSPIMIISNIDDEEVRVQALRSGADDFITLPISPVELVARIGTISKRKTIPARTAEPLRVGDLYIDYRRRLVYLKNELIDLTRIEYDLLYVLATNQGQVITHQELLEKVWGPEYHDATHYLWVNISRLRKKIEPDKNGSRYIHTESGIGYIFRLE